MSVFTLEEIKDSLGCQYPDVGDGQLQLDIDSAEFTFTKDSGVEIDPLNHMNKMAVCLHIHSLYEAKESLRSGWAARFRDCINSAKFQRQYKQETGKDYLFYFDQWFA